MRKIIILLLALATIPLVGAQVSVNLQSSPNTTVNLFSVNSSEFWDNLDSPDDITGSEFWYNQTAVQSNDLNLSGTNANQDINISPFNLEVANLTIMDQITFRLGEIIDNIVDGWITITGNTNITGNLTVHQNATFGSDVLIEGILHGGSPVEIAGINVTENVFDLMENRNSSSRFTLQNINESSNATTLITAKNDVGGSMSIGIASSSFVLGGNLLSNITALLSKSIGDMYFANFYNKPFRWLLNPQNDGDAANLVDVMRLDETGLNVSENLVVGGNITGTNVFEPQYISVHSQHNVSLIGASVWTNVTFGEHDSEIKRGIEHSAIGEENITFNITQDGVYDIDFDFDVIDTSLSSSDIDVAGRVTYINGTELAGSVFEVDITKRAIENELSHNFMEEFRAGDIIMFQFIAADADVVISTHGTFGDEPEAASIIMFKVANLPA